MDTTQNRQEACDSLQSVGVQGHYKVHAQLESIICELVRAGSVAFDTQKKEYFVCK